MRFCLGFKVGGTEFTNPEAEAHHSVNCCAPILKFAQPNRVAVACDAHQNAAAIREIAEFQILMWVSQPACTRSGVQPVELPQRIWIFVNHRKSRLSNCALDQVPR
jgi:hypothetical protein